MIRKFATVAGTFGIIGGFIGFIIFMGSLKKDIKPEAVAIAPPVVLFVTAATEPTTLDVNAQGEVRPRTDINLTAEISGKIIRMSDKFVDGGAFEVGDVLIEIEDADYEIALTGAKARVAQAEEGLRREEAEAALAQRDYDELERPQDASDLTLRLPQLAQARANYEAAKAEYRAAQLNLDRTRIKAPFKGRVRNRFAGEGQFITPGAQLGMIYSTDVAEIRLSLTDNDLAKLGLPIGFIESDDNPGPTATLSAVIAGRFHEWPARVARIDGAINAATRQVNAVAVVEDPYGKASHEGTPLAMGLFVDALVQGRPFENAVILPRTALYGRDLAYVIADGDILEERRVTVVSSDKDTITIAGGIVAGERVVTSPLGGAGRGDEVTPTEAANLNNRLQNRNDLESTSDAPSVAEAQKSGDRL